MKIVWVSNVNPKDNGCFINANINVASVISIVISKISEISLN
jgi:hypothetical protein